MSIHHHLRQLRLERGMTQAQVAEKIGVTRQALSSYESGRTQPDIDMLMRLSDVYETDLDEMIYGQSNMLKSMQRVKAAGAVTFILLLILTVVSSAFLWSANHFFAIPEGQLSPEARVLFAAHQRLTGAWETADEILLTVSLLAFVLLLVLLVAGRCVLPLKVKMIYITALSAAILSAAMLFGAADPVFTITDYLITPVLVIGRMMFFFIIDLIIERIQKRKKNSASDSIF